METKDIISESKIRLAENMRNAVSELGNLNKLIVKRSKSNETLSQSAKNFVSLEYPLENTNSNIMKLMTSSNNILRGIQNLK